MPRLVIQIDHEFIAGPMIGSKKLSVRQLTALSAKANPNDFSLCVELMPTEADDDGVGVSFEIQKRGVRNGAIFEVSIDAHNRLAEVRVKGEIASTLLRPGVTPHIQKATRNGGDFRLASFDYKGGKWSGFTAAIQGQDEADKDTWYRISNWALR
jgi:hypothetical protein